MMDHMVRDMTLSRDYQSRFEEYLTLDNIPNPGIDLTVTVLVGPLLSDEDFVGLLHSLSCAKYKILKKEPISGTISKTDVFEFDSNFTNGLQKIKIPRPPEVKEKQEKVVVARVENVSYAIDAALVRIMKKRRVLEDEQLVDECVELLRGKFEVSLKRISPWTHLLQPM